MLFFKKRRHTLRCLFVTMSDMVHLKAYTHLCCVQQQFFVACTNTRRVSLCFIAAIELLFTQQRYNRGTQLFYICALECDLLAAFGIRRTFQRCMQIALHHLWSKVQFMKCRCFANVSVSVPLTESLFFVLAKVKYAQMETNDFSNSTF